ncbi:hypothetical protein MARVELLAND_233 [Bacillus phage vB_BspM_MarvelLand]|nr:hypothetical protein MARVELLAND_233 [Bacillus phage vB_BspM_MarvelLand]
MQQPQGKQINPKHIFNEQQAYIFNLVEENIKMKAYIAQLEEEKAQAQEPKESAEPTE